jgi:hypothetical protein
MLIIQGLDRLKPAYLHMFYNSFVLQKAISNLFVFKLQIERELPCEPVVARWLSHQATTGIVVGLLKEYSRCAPATGIGHVRVCGNKAKIRYDPNAEFSAYLFVDYKMQTIDREMDPVQILYSPLQKGRQSICADPLHLEPDALDRPIPGSTCRSDNPKNLQ